MNLFKRIKWFFAVLGVFLLILATNLIDKNNFIRVEESVDNIYNERLLAKELLFDVSIKFHKKELAYSLNDTTYLRTKNDAINAEISKLLEMFNRVGSTKKEDLILNKLNKNHTKLIKLESNAALKSALYTLECIEIFSAINKNIVELASEQVKEGNNQKFLARKAIEKVKLFSQMEIYFLIFLGLILQFIILYNPKKKSN
jgi:hypothetical protein